MVPTEPVIPSPPAKRRLVVAVAELQIPVHLVAGVKQLRRWDDESPVTDAELLAAVTAVSSIALG